MKEVYEGVCTVVCSEDMHYASSHEKIGGGIAGIMLRHPRLKKLHGEKGNKLYVFSNLFPTEWDGIYKKGNVYQFRVRTSEKEFLTDMLETYRSCAPLPNQALHVIYMEIRKIKKGTIHTLQTQNPLIVTVDSGPWKLEYGLLLLQRRIQANVERKYEDATGMSLRDSPSFIEHIEILTEKPYAYRYKGRKLLSHKVRIMVKPDYTSQELAHIALGCGMGEKGSSLGAGFCRASYW